MRLLALGVGAMGPLEGRRWEFKPRMTVLTAPNEAGKTTFIDALLAALFGIPKGNTEEGKVFKARYEGRAEGLRAELETAGGRRLAAAPESPLDEALLDRRFAAALLVIRSGEAAVSAEKGFMDRFATRVLGAGPTDLAGAIEALGRVSRPLNKRSRWRSVPEDCRAKRDGLQARLARVSRADEAAREKSGLEAALSGLQAEIAGQESELKSLGAAASAARRKALARLRSAVVEAAEGLGRSAAPSRPELERLRELERSLRGSREAAARRRESLDKTRGDLAAAREAVESARREAAALADPKALAALREALEDMPRRGSPAPGGALGWSAALACVLAALLAAAVAWKIARSPAWSSLAAAAAGLAAYAGLRLAASAGEAARARRGFEAARDALGGAWTGLGPEAARSRFDEETARLSAAKTREEERSSRVEALARAAAEGEAALVAADDEARAADEALRAELGRFGAATVDKAQESSVEREARQTRLRDLEAQAAIELGAPGDGEGLPAALRRVMDDLDLAAAQVTDELRGLDPAELEARRRRGHGRLETLRGRAQSLADEIRNKEQAVHAARDPEGLSAAELDARRRKAEIFLRDIELWRKAASAAAEELAALRRGAADVLADCAAAASRLLPDLTDGRYSGLRIEGDPSDSRALAVERRELGFKPLDWLSRGAQDSVWLAMRLAMARRSLPEPGFVVLDEPFLHLDPGRTERAMRAVASEENLPGWQVIILTKDPRLARSAADSGLIAPGDAAEL